MQISSEFIPGALFGPYPTQKEVHELERENVGVFVNLTHTAEKGVEEYSTTRRVIRFPIRDGGIPSNRKAFTELIVYLSDLMDKKPSEKLYVHCKGGHGRAVLVAAVLFAFREKKSCAETLEHINKAHRERPSIKERWKQIIVPASFRQRCFLQRFLHPLFFARARKGSFKEALASTSEHPVVTSLGCFPTLEHAFQSHKWPSHKEYVERVRRARTPAYAKQLGFRGPFPNAPSPSWRVENLMYDLLVLKFHQNLKARENLLNTGLRPFIRFERFDLKWGRNEKGEGKNLYGALLEKVRLAFLRGDPPLPDMRPI